jgi:hypothetical protein
MMAAQAVLAPGDDVSALSRSDALAPLQKGEHKGRRFASNVPLCGPEPQAAQFVGD